MNLVCSYLKRFKTLLALVLFFFFGTHFIRHKSKILRGFTCNVTMHSI